MIRSGLRIKLAKFICCFMLIFRAFALSSSVHAAEDIASSPASAKVYSEMSENSNVAANLIAGNTFQIIEKVRDDEGAVWYRIKTDFGTMGYVRADEIERMNVEKQVMQQETPENVENSDSEDSDENDSGENEYSESVSDEGVSKEDDFSSPKREETDGEVIALANLNLRSMPSAHSNIVSKVKQGIRLKCYQKIANEAGENWYRVEYDGMEGYVIAKAVRLVKTQHSEKEEETEFETEYIMDSADSEENTEMETLPEELTQTEVSAQLEHQSNPLSTASVQFAFDVDEEPDAQKKHNRRAVDWTLITIITGEIICVTLIIVWLIKIQKLRRK